MRRSTPKGPPPPYRLGRKKKRKTKRVARFKDASAASIYVDAIDDPTVNEEECNHCHRSVRSIMEQTPWVEVFREYLCGCAAICEQCVYRAMRTDRHRCPLCDQRWQNIHIIQPMTYQEFLEVTRMDFRYRLLIAYIMAWLYLALFKYRYTPWWEKFVEVQKEDIYSKGATSFWHIGFIHYLYYNMLGTWYFSIAFVMTTLFFLVWGLCNRLIRNYLLPTGYEVYRWWTERVVDFRIIEPEP